MFLTVRVVQRAFLAGRELELSLRRSLMMLMVLHAHGVLRESASMGGVKTTAIVTADLMVSGLDPQFFFAAIVVVAVIAGDELPGYLKDRLGVYKDAFILIVIFGRVAAREDFEG